MRASDTRRGGRHVARERGSEEEPEPVIEYYRPEVHLPATCKLFEALNGQSLIELARWMQNQK